MTPMGAIHTGFAFIAIFAGFVVLRLDKGTRWHRTWGHLYAVSLATTCVTAFLLYNLTGRLGVFHIAAVVGGGTLAMGLYTVLARRPKKDWIEAHAYWMSWSYIGLMAAFCAESLTRFALPLMANMINESNAWPYFWSLVGVSSFGAVGIGAILVNKYIEPAIEKTPAAIRQERDELKARENPSA